MSDYRDEPTPAQQRAARNKAAASWPMQRRREKFYCAYPTHEGGRLIDHPQDQVRVSVVFWTKDNTQMLHRVPINHLGTDKSYDGDPLPSTVCRKCAHVWEALLRPRADQPNLF